MLAIAGQTAGPNLQIFLRDPMSTLGITKAKKSKCFLKFYGQRRAAMILLKNRCNEHYHRLSFLVIMYSLVILASRDLYEK